MELKISKRLRSDWRAFCKSNDATESGVTNKGINCILDDVEALEAALSTVQEPGALTDAQWTEIVKRAQMHPGGIWRSDIEEVLSSHPTSPAPEPAAPTEAPDDAAVVEEIVELLESPCGWKTNRDQARHILAVVRRGTYTREQVEKALRGYYYDTQSPEAEELCRVVFYFLTAASKTSLKPSFSGF